MVYKNVSSSFLKKFYTFVESSRRIVLTGHYSPDDDAVAAPLALQYHFKKKYPHKKIDLIYTGSRIEKYSSFTNYQEVSFVADLANNIGNYDLLIVCDGSQYSRFSNKPEALQTSVVKKICIDHHQSPPDKFDLQLINPSFTSTSEIVYDIIGYRNLDSKLSEILLLGILGDTGTFNYVKPGQYRIFSIVQKILKKGNIEIQDFKSRYNLIDRVVFDIIREYIKNSQFHKVKGWPDFQVSFVDRDYIIKNKITNTQLSEACDIFIGSYLRLIKGYSWGFSVKPYSDNSCSLSFRSLPKSVSVRRMVESMGLGGGHDRAAGAKIKPTTGVVEVADAIGTVIDWMKHHRPVII